MTTKRRRDRQRPRAASRRRRGGASSARASAGGVHQSLRLYGRGIAGGLLFSLPLLYTMEMWWTGFIADPAKVLAYLGGGFLLLLGYNRYGGVHGDTHWPGILVDSIEELGIGILLAAATLALLGRLTWADSFDVWLGTVVVEAVTVAIGVSVGKAQLGGRDPDDDSEEASKDGPQQESHLGGQLVIAFCGAVLVAANVAPTDEISLIAFETSAAKLLGVALASLAISGVVLFQSDFLSAHRFSRSTDRAEKFFGAATTYAVALVSSAVMLWFFGRFAGLAWTETVAQVVILALPATIGASAGRLLLQQ